MNITPSHTTKQKLSPNSALQSGNIAAGSGYSTDSQQVAPQLCYNATISSISQQSGSLSLDTALSFSDIQNEIKVSVSARGGFGMFSASAEANYLRSIEDKDYSLSLNYYTYFQNIAYIQIAGFGLEALSVSGKSIYDNGNNPYFGLICGDQYLASYGQGAMLLMGMNIEFSSSYEKEEFNAHAQASFGDIFSASGSIQQIASQYGISGSVGMQAFQIGGNPSQLSYILNKDASGDYYALTCNIQDMENCIKAASGMLEYAKSNFTAQFSFQNNTGLTPLGAGFASYEPINYIGITPPVSLVNQTVIDSRNYLSDRLSENQYYQQKFDELINGYLVPWDVTSNIYTSSEALYKIAQSNIEILMNPDDPQTGGLGCFTFPDQCEAIVKTIEANLQPITASELSFLKGFDGVEYRYKIIDVGAYVYRSGDQVWSGHPSLSIQRDTVDNRIIVEPYTFNLNSTTFTYVADFTTFYGKNLNQGFYQGSSTNNGMSFEGIEHDQYPPLWQITYSAETSPFYFEVYNATEQYLKEIGNTHEAKESI